MADVSVGGGSQQTSAEPSLERVMGPWLLLLFIVGDILGTGIYALTGNVAKQVGGVVWLPFLVAFVVALLTAFSYLELVTKYPRAAGAALYTHKAFGIHFVTFIVAFAVMCSGITSASTASRAFAANFGASFNLDLARRHRHHDRRPVFMAAVAVDQFPRRRREREGERRPDLRRAHRPVDHHHDRPVGDRARPGRRVARPRVQDRGRRHFWPVIAATTLAFFAMVGFEDSVNMAEECKDPVRHFPKVLLAGLLITGAIYVLVSISAITLVRPTSSAKARRRCSRWCGPARRASRCGSSASSRCSPSPTAHSSTC